jgi:hypothetical protein
MIRRCARHLDGSAIVFPIADKREFAVRLPNSARRMNFNGRHGVGENAGRMLQRCTRARDGVFTPYQIIRFERSFAPIRIH